MSKVTSLTLIGLLLVLNVFSQEDKLAEARTAFFANELEKAKTLVNEALRNESLAGDYQTWYWKGTIYKELYKTNEKGKNFDSGDRMEAITAYKRGLELGQGANEDTLSGMQKSLRFLASTLYNDAVVQLDTQHYEQAVENYQAYVDVTKFVDPAVDLTAQNVKFKMKLATIYVTLYEAHANDELSEKYFEKARHEYGEIINMNTTHLSANYNLGILFYNKAVHIIQSMEYDIDLEALSQKEEVCVELFLQALPYVKTAYELDPTRRETLISLKGIYYSLNDQEKYEKYKKELDELSN